MSDNPWGDLVFKLVAIPFILLLVLMIGHQVISLKNNMDAPERNRASQRLNGSTAQLTTMYYPYTIAT